MRLAALALLCCSCATLGAAPQEYELYRRVRVAPTVEARLSASHGYLQRHPAGRFEREVRAWFERTEPEYFARQRRTRAGLTRYLDTLPAGPNAARASERLAELDLADSYKRRRDAALTEEARQLEDKLQSAEDLRRAAVQSITGYVALLASIERWGVRTHELPDAVIVRYRMQEPVARCGTRRCLKTLTLPYAIPDGGRLRARAAIADVVLELTDGGVTGAEISGPELLLRMGEALSVRPVRSDDPLGRAEAVSLAVGALATALEPRLPAARCAQEAVGLRMLIRQCDAVRVEVIASDGPEADDRILIGPSAKEVRP